MDRDSADERESRKLIDYFLAGLSIPEKDLWVNLSPSESDRIVTDAVEQTELGEGLLKQDYLLKLFSSSLTHPSTDLGKQYWQTLSPNPQTLTPSSYSKIWIVPDRAHVLDDTHAVVIDDATLGVRSELQSMSSLLPVLTHEINNGERFSEVRQIYHALILAKWFKQKFGDSLYRQYIGSGQISGIAQDDTHLKDKVWQLYVQSVKKGVYDIVGDDVEKGDRGRRRYFCGGVAFGEINFSASALTNKSNVRQRGKLVLIDGGMEDGRVSSSLSESIRGIPDYQIFDHEIHAVDFHAAFGDTADAVWKFLEIDGSILNLARYTQYNVSSQLFGSVRHTITLNNGKRVVFYSRRADKLRNRGAVEAAARFAHDAIPAMMFIDVNGIDQVIQKSADGMPLLQKRRLRDDECMAVGYALGHVHKLGIVHGDLGYRISPMDGERLPAAFKDHIFFNRDQDDLPYVEFVDSGSMHMADGNEITQEMEILRDVIVHTYGAGKRSEEAFAIGYNAAYAGDARRTIFGAAKVKTTKLFTRRLADIGISLAAMAVLSPVMFVLIPIWIKMLGLIRAEWKGPVVIKQNRVGKDNKRFDLYKFRTLEYVVGDADLSVKKYLPGGKILRNFLDETPQLFNVLKGDMSVFGLRPFLSTHQEILEKHINGWRDRMNGMDAGLLSPRSLRSHISPQRQYQFLGEADLIGYFSSDFGLDLLTEDLVYKKSRSGLTDLRLGIGFFAYAMGFDQESVSKIVTFSKSRVDTAVTSAAEKIASSSSLNGGIEFSDIAVTGATGKSDVVAKVRHASSGLTYRIFSLKTLKSFAEFR
jgi:O-antigen biosynthesis protein WbqP